MFFREHPGAAMNLHQHSFEHVEGYLHHRPPYLLVDRIISMSESEIVTEKKVVGDEFFLTGHFPGAPIFPGAMLQEFTTQSAGILIAAKYNPMESFDTQDPFHNEFALGVLVRVHRSRFRGFARPGDHLTAKVTLHERIGQLFDFSATVSSQSSTIMSNGFQLTNIPSAILSAALRD